MGPASGTLRPQQAGSRDGFGAPSPKNLPDKSWVCAQARPVRKAFRPGYKANQPSIRPTQKASSPCSKPNQLLRLTTSALIRVRAWPGGGRRMDTRKSAHRCSQPRTRGRAQCRWPQRFVAARTLSSHICSARASMTTATLSSGSSQKPTVRSALCAATGVEEGPGQGFPRDRLPEHRPADEARARRDHHLHGRQLHLPRRAILG